MSTVYTVIIVVVVLVALVVGASDILISNNIATPVPTKPALTYGLEPNEISTKSWYDPLRGVFATNAQVKALENECVNASVDLWISRNNPNATSIEHPSCRLR